MTASPSDARRARRKSGGGLGAEAIILVIVVLGLLACLASCQWLLGRYAPQLSISILLNSFSPSAHSAFFTEMLLLIGAATLGVYGLLAPGSSGGFVTALRGIAGLAALLGIVVGGEGWRASSLAGRAAGDLSISVTAPWHAGWLLLVAGGLAASALALAFARLVQARRRWA